MRDIIFDNTPADLELLLAFNRLSHRGVLANIIVGPYQGKFGEWNVWHFVLGRIEFFLKLDQRPFPAAWKPYIANDNNPLILSEGDPIELTEAAGLRQIFSRMFRRRRADFPAA